MKPGSPSAGDRAQHLCNDGDSVDSFSISSDSNSRPKLTKAHKIMIAAGAVLLVVGVAVAVGVTLAKPKSSQPGELLSENYCSHLPDSSRQHCHNYFVSQGGAKFTAAADWRHYNQASCECTGVFAGQATCQIGSMGGCFAEYKKPGLIGATHVQLIAYLGL
jgi:hypothetical protein